MKKLLIILFFPIFLFAQTDIFGNRVRTDTLKAFKTTYGTLDSIHIKSRTNFTRPAEFDSSVVFLTRVDTPYTSVWHAIKNQANIFTARQYMTSNAVDTILAKSSGNKVYIQDSLKVSGNITSGLSVTNGDHSAAFGNSTTTGTASFAAGEGTASQYSAAFGTGDAVGIHSFAAGEESQANGYASAVFGSAITNGDYSFAVGFGAANGDYSFATGTSAANGIASSAFGSNITNNGNYSFVVSLDNTTRTVIENGYAYFMGGSTSKFSLGAISPDSSFTDSLGTGGGHFYGGLRVEKNIVASAGYLDSDSLKRDGTTIITGTYHSGLGASALGNVTVGTLNATTGTFSGDIKTTNANNVGIGDVAFVELGTMSGGSTTNTVGIKGITSDVTGGARVTDLGLFTGGSSGRFEGMRLIGRNGSIGKVVIGDTLATAVRFTVTNSTLYPKIQMWRNSRKDSVAWVDSSGEIAVKKVASINSVSTIGQFGVPIVVDTIDYTVSSSIGATTIQGSATGWFRFNYSLKTTTADVTATTVQLFVTSNDGGAITDNSALVALTATTNRDRGSFLIFNSSGNIQFYTTVVTGGTSAYNLRAWVERVQ